MGTWAVAACATVIFMSLYSSQDFAERLNFKIAPHLEFQIIAVIGIIVNFIFCYVWEVCHSTPCTVLHPSHVYLILCLQIYFLDYFLFQKVLPVYKVRKSMI